MARRKPKLNVTTVFEAIHKGAIDILNRMSATGVAGKRAIQRLAFHFPRLPQAGREELLEESKHSRLAARKLLTGQVQPGEISRVAAHNPTLPKQYRYIGEASIVMPGTNEVVKVRINIDSNKPLGRLAIANALERVKQGEKFGLRDGKIVSDRSGLLASDATLISIESR